VDRICQTALNVRLAPHAQCMLEAISLDHFDARKAKYIVAKKLKMPF
jgi:hypothetical protein